MLGLILGVARDVWPMHSPGADQEVTELNELGVWFICRVRAVPVTMVCDMDSLWSCMDLVGCAQSFGDGLEQADQLVELERVQSFVGSFCESVGQ